MQAEIIVKSGIICSVYRENEKGVTELLTFNIILFYPIILFITHD